MQSFELLGGKYQQGEQILPGLIQTFRSYEVPTGRPVFIHRIPSNDPAAKEIAGLLSAGLIRSPIVRKMLLDVYEREPYRFVVTEPARQCVPLRDWLEREAEMDDALEAEDAIAPAVATAHPEAEVSEQDIIELESKPKSEPTPAAAVAADVEMVEPPPDAETSEFARLFHEALSGKLERSRRSALGQMPTPSKEPDPILDEPDEEELEPPVLKPAAKPQMTLVPREPAATLLVPKTAATKPTKEADKKAIKPPVPQSASSPAVPTASEPELFSQVAKVEDAGRSTLVIFLVVLGVLVVLLVMFVVVVVKR